MQFFILLGYLSIYISSYYYTSYEIKDIPEQFIQRSASYSFEVSLAYKYDDLNYLTIKVENQYQSSLGQIAFLSFSDKNCESERNQMSISHDGDSIMIIKKSEIKSLNKFYICVTCLSEDNCLYNLKFDQNYIQRMPMADISYSYYASQNYTQMQFGIRAEDKINDEIQKYLSSH